MWPSRASTVEAMETALSEITLVLFTTLGPAGAVAYGLMALPLIAKGQGMELTARVRLDRFLCIPIVVAMVGLVASATHLGNPANALYVITGFGRSPLSNEVICGVVFLGAAGVFWLTSFSDGKPRVALRRILAAIVSVLGLVLTGAIALAYDAETILTWNSLFTPVTIWFGAFAGGALLALCGFRFAGFFTEGHRLGFGYLILAMLAFIGALIAYLLWNAVLPEMQNALTSAADLAPAFGPMIGLFGILGSAGLLLALKAVAWKGEAPLWMPVTAAGLMLAGLFLMRFQFYLIHMTVGL